MNSRPANRGGRSSAVALRKSQIPCRSGWPSASRGTPADDDRGAEPARKAEWNMSAARAQKASADLAGAVLLGLRDARAADFDGIRRQFPAVAEGCTACHRAFSREAPAIKP